MELLTTFGLESEHHGNGRGHYHGQSLVIGHCSQFFRRCCQQRDVDLSTQRWLFSPVRPRIAEDRDLRGQLCSWHLQVPLLLSSLLHEGQLHSPAHSRFFSFVKSLLRNN